MQRTEYLKILLDRFDRAAREFCEETSGLFCDISSAYKGEEAADSLQYRNAKIIYNTYAVVFRYTAHGPVSMINSIVDAWVYFGKSENELPIPLDFVADFCGEDAGKPLVIPYIFDETGMAEAFACVADAVRHFLPQIAAISYDEQQVLAVRKYFVDEFKTITGQKTLDPYFLEYFCGFTTVHMASIYAQCMKGNPQNVIKGLKKAKALYRCEKRLLALFEAGQTVDCSMIPAVVGNMIHTDKNGLLRIDVQEFPAFFVSWLVLTIPISLVYLAIFFLFILLQQQSAVYLAGAVYNFPMVFSVGLLTAIPVSYFTRFRIMRLFFRKNYEKLVGMDYITNGAKDDKLIRGLLYVVTLVCVIATILFSYENMSFREDGFVDNRAFFSISGTYYSYDEIDRVQYIPNRVNGFGDTLDYPSYALIMKDGKEIDLYDIDEIENYDPVLLNFLREKGVRIENESATEK